MLKRIPSTQFVTPHSSAQRWPRRTSMPSVFTVFVSGLRGAATPDADLFHDAWHGLRAALVQEMKKRGLWQSPPSYLGVYGWESWGSEALQGSGSARTQSALGELVADCYAFIFVDRLQSLKRHLQDKPDIDGLVLLNVRHFLHERGVETFRLKDLLDPLKRDARRRWAAQVPPEGTEVSGQSFEHLARRVSASIERMEADSRTRTQLRTLWHHLWRQHGKEGQEAGRLPSYRQLGQRLNIPRERLPVLFDLLRQLVP